MQIRVRARPNSRRQQVIENPDGSLIVCLQSPPGEGKANQELIAVLSEHLRVAKSRITIQSGAGSRSKLIEVAAALQDTP